MAAVEYFRQSKAFYLATARASATTRTRASRISSLLDLDAADPCNVRRVVLRQRREEAVTTASDFAAAARRS
jgi:hypothetical protein